MQICLVSQEFPPETAHGGIGTQTWNKARMLTRLGHKVHVLSCAAGEGPQLRSELLDGAHVHRMRPPGYGFEVNSPPAYAIGYTWQVMQHLRALCRMHSFDIINFPEYSAEGFVFQIDRMPWNWVPIIVQLHGPLAMFTERVGWPPRDSEHHRVLAFMEGTCARLADALMASSANIADFSARYYGLDRRCIDVVHCGIDCDVFRPPPQDQRNARPTILFVGNLVSAKGVMTVLEAALRLRCKYPELLLRLVGKGEEEEINRIKRRAVAENAQATIEIQGFIRDRERFPALYQDAHIFASPAVHEPGVANVYVEAMACGCPVVAASTGGAPEAVSDGYSGLLVAPGDVDATATALDRLLGDSALRHQLGRNGRQRAVEYFSLEKYIQRVLAAYQKTIERSQRKLAQMKDINHSSQ